MAGGTEDVRKLFIFTTAQNYFGLAPGAWDQPLLYHSPEINNFLDDGNQMLLRVQRCDDALISLSNAVRLPHLCPAPFTPPVGPAAAAGRSAASPSDPPRELKAASRPASGLAEASCPRPWTGQFHSSPIRTVDGL